jgi:hypothetical protein
MHIRFKSEYLSYSVPRNMTFFDIVTVKFYSFVNVKKKTSDFFVSCYLKKLFQLRRLDVNRQMSYKSVKNSEQLTVLD